MFGSASLGMHGSIPVTRIRIGSSTGVKRQLAEDHYAFAKHSLASERIFRDSLKRHVIAFPVASLATRNRIPRLTLNDSRVPTTDVSFSYRCPAIRPLRSSV